MRTALLIVINVFVLVVNSEAQFNGAYAPSNWTTSTPAPSNGSVNSSSAPSSIIITGSNDATNAFTTNVRTDYTISTTGAGIYSFHWVYHSNDSDNDPKYDRAGILINGTFTQLTSNTVGAVNQSGDYTSPSQPAGSVIGFRILATDNAFGNATFTVSNFVPPAGTLPVKFTYFNATKETSRVHLQWATALEINSHHFNVERSQDGIKFSIIATVAAQVNSSVEQTYSTTDLAPINGRNYYRVREVDIDGKEQFTKIIAMDFLNEFKVNIFPNPTTNNISIDLGSFAGARSLTLQILNSSGQVVKKMISSNRNPAQRWINWDLSALRPGAYFIKIEGEKTNQQFLKR